MRYNPYAHAMMEADYITKKNNPNTFDNIFSRDQRVCLALNIKDKLLLEKLKQYECSLEEQYKSTVDNGDKFGAYKSGQNSRDIINMVNKYVFLNILESTNQVPRPATTATEENK